MTTEPNSRNSVSVDWSGSGLLVYLFNADGKPTGLYSTISDVSGHWLEPFIGALARRVTELENEIAALQ